ncbi:MAG: nicotinate phosphoribosyltransferase [Chloroflexi bacterium]|nr:nicotinate phosphoribosyltransferase [Chloroflexota bacterium]
MKQPYSNALFADLYELTMAQAYWQHDWQAEATFSMFFREYPPDRGYLVYAGLEDLLNYLDELRFEERDIEYLRASARFDDAFLDWLADLRFTGSVRSMTEGEIFFANEPVVEVTGPIIEAQLIETYLMNQINLQTTLATKAARVMHAGRGRQMVEFAARRTQGSDAANKLARVCYLTGFAGTSNVQAAAIYGMPPVGTMAHSFITSFASEREAFEAYVDSFPDTTTLLVDTYDTIQGTRNAIEVGLELERRGHRLRSIRLDSGDLLALSIECRRMLDDAGLDYVDVFASGGLDEYYVEALVDAGAPIAGFGVGTKLGVSADAPWTDCAYKLVEFDGRPVLKLSTGKETLPGRKQVWRVPDGSPFGCDVIARADEAPPTGDATPLLHEVVRDSRRVGPSPTLADLRARFAENSAELPEPLKALRSPASYVVEVSPELRELQRQVRDEVVARELG